MKKSEIRKDYLLDRYVIIAPRRAKRPEQIKAASVTVTPVSPFTPDHLSKNKIIDSLGTGKQRVVVVKNIYPAVTLQNAKAYGTQEVIVDFPDPSLRLADASLDQIIRIFRMYAKRVKAVEKLSKIDYIICFKNEGAASGASIQHEHSQIFASALVPPLLVEERAKLAEYHKTHNTSFYEDLIKKEMKSRRAVYEDKYIAVFTPYASAYQYEVWIFTKRHVDNISLLNKQELQSLAKILKKLLLKLKKLGLAYNYFSHQIVSEPHQHFCLKIQPRGSIWAGVELDAGLVVNFIPPEEAAAYYRKG